MDDPFTLKAIILAMAFAGYSYGIWRVAQWWQRRETEGKTDSEILHLGKTEVKTALQKLEDRYNTAVAVAKRTAEEINKLRGGS
jgi:hypothetical protein